tara:strand:+ start:704 stop:1405 length:702 start_codon:yes stop_codon:yes gene_type:complete
MARKKSELLKEELDLYNRINSYYLINEQPEDELPIGVPEEGFEEEDEEEEAIDTEMGDEVMDDAGDEEVVDTEVDTEVMDDVPAEEVAFEDNEEEAAEEVEEVDVTEIVTSTKETAEKVDSVTSKVEDILAKFGDLEGKLSGMGDIINKIDSLEKEVEMRNPTPVEKLEMRSLDSFPFNVKLTDYWSDEKEGGEYKPIEKKEKDFGVSVEDLSNYNSEQIKSSFDADDEENMY